MPAEEVKNKADNLFFNSENVIPHVWVFSGLKQTQATDLFMYNSVEDSSKTAVENFISKVYDNQNAFSEILRSPKRLLQLSTEKVWKEIEKNEPKFLNVEPTFDGSAMFSFELNNKNCYLEYFFNHSKDIIDEVTLIAFEEKNMSIDFSGSLEDAMNEIAFNIDSDYHLNKIYDATSTYISTNTFTATGLQVY